MTDPNNSHLGLRPVWHWLNVLLGRHTCVAGVSLEPFDKGGRSFQRTEYLCESCGHGWIETKEK